MPSADRRASRSLHPLVAWILLMALLLIGWSVWLLVDRGNVPKSGDDAGGHPGPDAQSSEQASEGAATQQRIKPAPSRELVADSMPAETRAERGLRALVVDLVDAPVAGCPVAFGVRHEKWSRELSRATTDALGIASVTTASPLIDDYARPRLKLAIAAPLAEPVEAPIDLDRLPAEPVKLRLPPTGRVVVKLVTSDLRPYGGTARVIVARAQTGEGKPRPFFEGIDSAIAEAKEGRATFPHAGVGIKLVAIVRPSDETRRTVSEEFDGPSSAGAEAVVEIRIGQPAALVVGRLVGRDGAPAAKAVLSAELLESNASATSLLGGGTGTHAWTRTEQDGRFTLRFDRDPELIETRRIRFDFTRVRFDTLFSSPPEDGFREVVLPEEIRAGKADLGDVVPPKIAVVVAGQVVSERGAPIPRAWIVMMVKQAGEWMEMPSGMTRGASTGSQGMFYVPGNYKGEIALVARSERFISNDPLAVQAGDENVRIVLETACTLEGSFRGDGSRRSMSGLDRFRGVFARPFVSGPATRGIPDADTAFGVPATIEGARFSWKGLRPGAATVSIVVGEATSPALLFENVAVRPGETSRDPRLQGIDLSKVLAMRTVTVLDGARAPIADASVFAHVAPNEGALWAIFATDDRGKATVSTAGPSVEAFVRKKGYRSVHLGSLAGDTEVTLERAVPSLLTVKLDPAIPLPEAPAALGIEVQWAGAPGQTAGDKISVFHPMGEFDRDFRFGTDRTVTVQVPEPGVYEVIPRFMNGHSSRRLEQPERLRALVAVDEGAPPPTVTLVLDEAALRTAGIGR